MKFIETYHWLTKLIFILVSFFVFQFNVITVSASTLNSEFDPHSSVSETYVQGEIVNKVWGEVGLRQVLSKNELGSNCED